MVRVNDGHSTHLPMLARCVAATDGPVLELGAGWYSTPVLHELCRGRHLTTVETNLEWLDSFARFASIDHELVLREHADRVFEMDWSVVLIDHRPAEQRAVDLEALRHRARFLVVHDTEPHRKDAQRYDIERVLRTFRFRSDYTLLEPWTSVVSMSSELP